MGRERLLWSYRCVSRPGGSGSIPGSFHDMVNSSYKTSYFHEIEISWNVYFSVVALIYDQVG